jgi:SAM-dependent methyltransferase
LETAKKDFKVLGLEPDENVFNASSRRSLPVRMGYFPDALDESEKFDIIVFNDVIEHIPDMEHTLASCHQHLNKEGLLVLNLPSSNGVFYRLSKIFCRFGFPSFFERLWQKDLPSPHLHYFNLKNLTCLLKQNEFDVKNKGSLSTLRLAGLYTRISYTGNLNIMTRIFIYIAVVLVLPILKVLPSDIIYVIAKQSTKRNNYEK